MKIIQESGEDTPQKNMCVMRHLALSLINKESEEKLSVPWKKRKANLYEKIARFLNFDALALF